jgi:glutamate-ammonia-ligase adenylyltransferase
MAQFEWEILSNSASPRKPQMTPTRTAPNHDREHGADRIDPTRAVAAVSRWRRALAEGLGQDPGAALDEPRRMLTMLKMFGATRRLADLCLKHPVFAGQALLEGPSQVLAEAARDLTALNGGVGGADVLYAALSPIKNRADLAIAIAEISGEWTSAQATAARTDLAERLVETALAWLVRGAVSRGELKVAVTDAGADGVFVLAGGDFSHEDLAPYGPLELVAVYDGAKFDGPALRMAERAFVRIGAEMKETFEGKPGDYPLYAVKTPMGTGVGGAGLVDSRARVEAALKNPQQNNVKRWVATARVVAGDRKSGGEFLEAAEELIWGGGEILGENGRAELMKQSEDPRASFRAVANIMRWSFGRARPVFRTASARDVYRMAASAGALTADVAARLSASAELAQTIVARAQMMKGAAGFGASKPDEEAALASLCGYVDYAGLAAVRDGAIADARNALTRLLEGPRAEFSRYRSVENAPDDVDKLQDLGFRDGANLSTMIDGWAALCEAGGGARFSAIAPGLLTAFGETQHPDEAVRLFDAMLRIDENGGATLQAAGAESSFRDGFIDALGCFGAAVAPLAQNEESSAALFEARGAETPKSGKEWVARYAPPAVKAGARAVGAWRKEQIARIALYSAADDMSFDAAASALEAVHMESLSRVFDIVCAGVDAKANVSLHVFDGAGAGLPGYATPIGFVASDCEPDKGEEIARAFLTATGEMGEGLFAISPDVSHRPGGASGALAPDIAQLKSYIQSEAVAHDQILLARARVIAGAEAAQSAAIGALRTAVGNPKRADILLRDLDRARAQRLRRDKAGSAWDFEHSEGGLFDVDLIISTLIYRHAGAQPGLQKMTAYEALDLMSRAGILTADVAETLKGARAFWTRLAAARALARWSDPQQEPVRPRFAALLARAAEVENFTQVRPIMRGYAEEVTRLYGQLVLGRPSLSLVANG